MSNARTSKGNSNNEGSPICNSNTRREWKFEGKMRGTPGDSVVIAEIRFD